MLLLAVLASTSASAAPKQELTLAAGVDSAYDGNVYNGRGPDWVNRVDPWLNYRLIGRQAKLDTGYELGYWTYAFGKADNSINHRGHLIAEMQPLRRLTVRVGNEITRAQDPGFLNRFGVVAPQIGIVDNIADLTLGYAFTHRLYGAATYTNHLAIFDPFTPQMVAAGDTPLFDGMEQDANVGFAYRVFRTDDLRMGGRFQNFTAGPQDGSVAEWLLANTYTPTLGWRHQFVPQLEWVGDAGPIFYQELGGAVNVPGSPPSGTGWKVGTSLRWYTPTWRAAVSYTHDLVGATGAGAPLWGDFVYGQVGFHYLELVDVHAGTGYFRNGRAVNQPVAYDGITADIIADWRVINNLRLGGYYTVRWQELGPGAALPGTPVPQFPAVTRNIVGIRLLAVVGADARPPRREVHE
jgi:hypothetical protein